MTAVIYARYLLDKQREESIEGQIRECTGYAEKNGIKIEGLQKPKSDIHEGEEDEEEEY